MNPLDSLALSIFAPRHKQTVVEWAEANLVLSGRVTNIPGPYSTRLVPYVREPLESFGNDAVRDLCLCWGAQTSKTTLLMSGLGYRIDNAPCPSMWVMPTELLAKSFSESRWQPLVNDSPALERHKPENLDKFKLSEQHFDSMTLNFIGSNSPGNLSSRPVALVVCDETDKFATASSKEAAAVMLADARTTTFPLALRVKTSTPTVEGGTIWQEFLKGDQRYYFIPCPFCKHSFHLKWEMVKWCDKTGEDWDLKEVKASAYLECPECKGKILDGHKTTMLRAGEWRATSACEPGRRSYHLSSLYAPWVTFGELAVKFLQDKKSLFGLQDFINSKLALPWVEQFEEDELPKASQDYSFSIAYEKWGDYRFCTIDVQARSFWILARAWKKSGESRLLHCSNVLTWEDCRMIQERFEIQDHLTFPDSGYETATVYSMCCRFGWTAFKGEERQYFTHIMPNGRNIRRIYSSKQKADPGIGLKTQGRRCCALFLFADPTAKDLLGRLKSGKWLPWQIPHDVPPFYIEQIGAEVKREKRNAKTGQTRHEWIRIKKDNHLFDCEKMQVVAAAMAGILVETGEDDPAEEKP